MKKKEQNILMGKLVLRAIQFLFTIKVQSFEFDLSVLSHKTSMIVPKIIMVFKEKPFFLSFCLCLNTCCQI